MNDLTDEKILEMCSLYGKQALEARYLFLGMLPEVNQRQLYRKAGFNSVFEFSFKLAGVSEEQVRRVLSLDKKFYDKPALHSALVSGAVSVNKLAKIASIATAENADELANLVKTLPQKALEVFVRDERAAVREELVDVNVLQMPLLDTEFVRAHKISGQQKVELSDEVNQKLCDLQRKGFDVDALLLEFLAKREVEIEENKGVIPREMNAPSLESVSSRHIPVRVRQVLDLEYGSKCSIPNCDKPYTTIHHTSRFAIARRHDPRFMAPLCYEHHLIAHNVDGRFMEKRQRLV